MSFRVGCFIALALLLDLGGLAQADAGAGLVELRFETCDAVRVDDVRARIAIELPGSSHRNDPSFAPTVVVVSCAPLSVKLSVDDPLTGKALARTVALTAMDADVRARTIAIAIAELVEASWSELETNPSPRVPPIGPRPSASATSDALRVLQREPTGLLGGRLRVTAVASTQVFFSSTKVLWGGGLRLAADSWRVFGWAVDLLEHHGEVSTDLGHVAIDTVTLGASALAHRSWSRVGVRGGLGLRLGATILRGLPPPGSAVHGGDIAWGAGGPFCTFGMHVVPVRGLVIELATEAGYSIFSTGGLVNGKRELAIEGPWVGAQLGIGITL